MTEDTQRVWDLMEKFSICMMNTWNGEELRVRPMSANLDRERNAIRFLTDTRWHADDEIIKYPKLALSFADNGNQKYVAVSGRGAISNDRARIKELFSIPAKAWWESADDPNIRLLTVTPIGAEYWGWARQGCELFEHGHGRRDRQPPRSGRKAKGVAGLAGHNEP